MLLSGFVHLVLSQVCTRLITFALNLLNARLLTPEAYGVSPGAVRMPQHAASPAFSGLSLLCLRSAAVRSAISPHQYHHPVPQQRGLPQGLPAHQAGEAVQEVLFAALIGGM